jgi:hypothetical protein
MILDRCCQVTHPKNLLPEGAVKSSVRRSPCKLSVGAVKLPSDKCSCKELSDTQPRLRQWLGDNKWHNSKPVQSQSGNKRYFRLCIECKWYRNWTGSGGPLVHQFYYGGDWYGDPERMQGFDWDCYTENPNMIEVSQYGGRADELRVLIWKLPAP